MGVGGRIGEVVDGCNFQFPFMVLVDGAQGQPANAPETVNSDSGCHLVFPALLV